MPNGKVITFRMPVTIPSLAADSPPPEKHSENPVQQNLFPTASLVILFRVREDTGQFISRILERVQPGFAVDFRPIPRFDFGAQDREKVFKLFAQLSSSYVDMSKHKSEVWRNELNGRLFSNARRPILIFINDRCRNMESEVVMLMAKHKDWTLKKIDSVRDLELGSWAAGL